MELPTCPNFKEGRCERSEVFVGKETDDGFILCCRTCGCKNFWPKDKAENRGRYEAFLSRKAQAESEEKIRGLRRAYNVR
jgi:hypothetical protein